MTNDKGSADLTRDDATPARGARPPSLDRRAEVPLSNIGRERVMDDLGATPKVTSVWSFRELCEYGPLPALRRYDGPTLAVVTPVNGARFGLHYLGVGLPHTAVSGTGHWLRMDKPGEFDRILDGFLARVRAAGVRRSQEPGE
jgi:hypothetical protein